MAAWTILAAAIASVSGTGDLDRGLAGAFAGCESWVLEPATWAENPAGLPSHLDLSNTAGWVTSLDESQLPPLALRKGLHFLRINSTPTAGFALVVSDQVPICHITGGGASDLQPVIESALASPAFRSRWHESGRQTRHDMVSTMFTNVTEPRFQLVVSRATKANQRQDRVQLVATAIFNVDAAR